MNIKAALQVKPDLHLWASPWVVPCWMMSDAQTLGAHALYMARFVEALQFTKGFGVQWNLQAAVATLAQKGPVQRPGTWCSTPWARA